MFCESRFLHKAYKISSTASQIRTTTPQYRCATHSLFIGHSSPNLHHPRLSLASYSCQSSGVDLNHSAPEFFLWWAGLDLFFAHHACFLVAANNLLPVTCPVQRPLMHRRFPAAVFLEMRAKMKPCRRWAQPDPQLRARPHGAPCLSGRFLTLGVLQSGLQPRLRINFNSQRRLRSEIMFIL